MNIEFEQSREENFKRALSLCTSDISREEIFRYLQTGNLPERQYAVLELDSIQNQEEADILMSNLTGCDGKIREAVAYKLTELVPEYINYFYKFPRIFADATIDINANISRMIIEVLSFFKQNELFAKQYLEYVFEIINEAINIYDGFIFRDKKYTINKQLFKIYWCLEGINIFYDYTNETELFKILNYCSNISEYTIREKVALVLNRENLPQNFLYLKNKLKTDENYYVKQFS